MKNPNSTGKIDNSTLLQVDAMVIVGVLFFLTLATFIPLPESYANALVGLSTLSLVIPFAVSAILIISGDIILTIRGVKFDMGRDSYNVWLYISYSKSNIYFIFSFSFL